MVAKNSRYVLITKSSGKRVERFILEDTSLLLFPFAIWIQPAIKLVNCILNRLRFETLPWSSGPSILEPRLPSLFSLNS